jgi:hypothetical protein
MSNHHPRRAIGAAQRRAIEERLARHAKFMAQFEDEGMSHEEASQKAFQLVRVNHANPPDPYALLETAGRALYDEDWSTPLAHSLGVSPDTMRKWKRRKIRLDLNHDILRRALRLLQRRAVTTASAAKQIAKVIS